MITVGRRNSANANCDLRLREQEVRFCVLAGMDGGTSRKSLVLEDADARRCGDYVVITLLESSRADPLAAPTHQN